MIAYDFPPSGESGVHRILRFMRHLPESGWVPSIVTVQPACYPSYRKTDPSLLDRVPERIEVVRTPVFSLLDPLIAWRNRLFRRGTSPPAAEGGGEPTHSPSPYQRFKDFVTTLASIPDEQIGWLLPAVWASVRAIRRQGISVLYTTGNPWTTHLIGLSVAALTGIAWVADFRDPWVGNPYVEKAAWLRRIDAWLEARVVARATRVIANTDSLARHFGSRYPEAGEKFLTIPNGFEEEEFAGLPEPIPRRTPPFTICHAGTIYSRRTPTALFEALAASEALRENFRIRLIGGVEEPTRFAREVERYRLTPIVEIHPPIPHAQALHELARADLLLVLQNDAPLQIPGKLYEYLRIGRPILAVTEGGATAELIESCRAGWVAGDAGQIATALEAAVERLSTARPPAPSPEVVRAFDTRHLTARLAALFEAISG